MQDFYIDTFIIYNFLMDAFSLFLTARLLRLTVYRARLLASSAVGTLYAVLCLFISEQYMIIITVTVPFLMILISYETHTKIKFLKATVLFWCISILTGGIITAESNLLSSIGDSSRITALLLVFGVALCLAMTKVIYKNVNQRLRTASCELVFTYMNEEYALSGIIDSGNLVTEITTGLPVVFTNSCLAKKIPKENLVLSVRAGGLGGQKCYPAFHPQEVFCVTAGRRYKTDAVIALDIENNDYSGADSLVPLSLI